MTATRRGGARRDDDTDGAGGGLLGGGGASVRGALLIAAAVLVGVVLLSNGFRSGTVPSTGSTSDEEAATDDDGDGDGGEGTEGGSTTTTAPTPVTHLPAEVRVIVLNGGGPTGAAGTSTTALGAAGFVTLEAGNTDPDVPASTIYFAPGFDADAAVIATSLGITNVPVALPVTPPSGTPAAGEVDIVVILGPEFVPVA